MWPPPTQPPWLLPWAWRAGAAGAPHGRAGLRPTAHRWPAPGGRRWAAAAPAVQGEQAWWVACSRASRTLLDVGHPMHPRQAHRPTHCSTHDAIESPPHLADVGVWQQDAAHIPVADGPPHHDAPRPQAHRAHPLVRAARRPAAVLVQPAEAAAGSLQPRQLGGGAADAVLCLVGGQGGTGCWHACRGRALRHRRPYYPLAPALAV